MPEARWCAFRPRGTAILDRNGICIVDMATKQAEYNEQREYLISPAL